MQLLDLQGIELDGSFAAKHGNHDFEFAFLGVNFGDGALEAFEWAVDDGDNFAHLVVDGVFGVFYTHALLDFGDFFLGNWGGLGAVADKAGDTWSVANDVPSLIRQAHFDQDIALENLAVDNFAFAVFDFDALLFWYDGVEDFALKFGAADALVDTFGDLVLVTAVGTDGVPSASVVITVYCHNFSFLIILVGA